MLLSALVLASVLQGSPSDPLGFARAELAQTLGLWHTKVTEALGVYAYAISKPRHPKVGAPDPMNPTPAMTNPTLVIDAGTESAFWPDLLNWLDLPFLTLGEVIAKEQGVSAMVPIDGPIEDGDVLSGKGGQLANQFLRNAVINAAKRSTPTSLSAFEMERMRRKREVLRSLGLEPMPPKTSLHPRETGFVQRDGYYIEKVVIESRSDFFVTMHVYVPGVHSAPETLARPLIVNVNGHWDHKKDEDRIQLRCAFQALQGYIAVAVDSPGWAFERNHLFERKAEGPHNDFKLVEGGSNATGYYVWDTIRALDYMSTRTDVDMNRVGITGASGGGLATLYVFAADDRYKAAVPVVYMASMELAPDNGCLCNHVPGTLQIGDRSDVAAIQAPKPILVMGAQNDGEFPADATMLTHEKIAKTWDLFGKASDTYVKIFPGGHDYNQGMREAMIGFFNRYVRGDGDGTPVPQPPLAAIDPEDHQLLVLDPPPAGEMTMREISNQYLTQAPGTVAEATAIAVNGGLPTRFDPKLKITGTGRKRSVTFESEPGLVTPGILFMPEGKPKGLRLVAADSGKAVWINGRDAAAITADGYAVVVLDLLGTGELADIDLRYPVYLGRSVAFTGGWQLVQAAGALKALSGNAELIGDGPISSQAVMWAGLQAPRVFNKVTGHNCLARWSDVFGDAIPDAAIQPRAHLCGSLTHLRGLVKHGDWTMLPELSTR